MIVTQELRTVTNMGLRDIKYDIGPFITLIDGPSFSFQWQERPKLLLGQIQDADSIALSRTDLIDAPRNRAHSLNLKNYTQQRAAAGQQ